MYMTGEKLEAFKAKHYFDPNCMYLMMRGAIQVFFFIYSIKKQTLRVYSLCTISTH